MCVVGRGDSAERPPALPSWRSDCHCDTVGLTPLCPGCLLLGKDLGSGVPLGHMWACSLLCLLCCLPVTVALSLSLFFHLSFHILFSHLPEHGPLWSSPSSHFPPLTLSLIPWVSVSVFHFSSLPPSITLSTSRACCWEIGEGVSGSQTQPGGEDRGSCWR